MAMHKVKGKIENIIADIVEKSGYEMVDIEFKEGKGATIEVFIWNENGISVSDCRKISNEISDALDIADLIANKYYLVVSSPGLDRPLYTKRDFERSIGEKVKVILKEGSEKSGELISIKHENGEDFIVLTGKKGTFDIPILNIKKGKIQIMP